MATLIDQPNLEWIANEVIELAASDEVEGAATGASYSGIGRSNQQAQQLANRTSFLYGRQNTNITNIGVLQAFVALFTGSVDAGFLYVPFADIARGQLQMLVQWGIVADPVNGILPGNYPVGFPRAFGSKCLLLLSDLYHSSAIAVGGGNIALVEAGIATKTGFQAVLGWDIPAPTVAIRDGFSWLAIGY